MVKLAGIFLTFVLMFSAVSNAAEYRQIIKDEGVVYEVYVGPKGYLHAGVGHFLPQDGSYKVGDKVTKKQVADWFWEDYNEAETISEKFFPRAPKEIRDVLTNMAFNLGESRLFEFKRLRQALEEERWFEAAYEMQESLWYDDVGYRSKRLVDRVLRYGRLQRIEPE